MAEPSRQAFVANTVTVNARGDPLMVAFGDVEPDQTVVHSLIFMQDDDHAGPNSIHLVFNDQSNCCSGSSIEGVELARDRLLIRLRTGARILSGKYDQKPGDPLSEIEVRFEIRAPLLEEVKEGLHLLLKQGCGLRTP